MTNTELALASLITTPASFTTTLEPVKMNSTWVAVDPEGGVWWPNDDLNVDLNADTVVVAAELAPHLGTWHA